MPAGKLWIITIREQECLPIKRSELISKCRHMARFLLSKLAPEWCYKKNKTIINCLCGNLINEYLCMLLFCGRELPRATTLVRLLSPPTNRYKQRELINFKHLTIASIMAKLLVMNMLCSFLIRLPKHKIYTLCGSVWKFI